MSPGPVHSSSVSAGPSSHRQGSKLELRKLKMWPEPCGSPWDLFPVHRGHPVQCPRTQYWQGKEGGIFIQPICANSKLQVVLHHKRASSTPLIQLPTEMHIVLW